MKLTTRLLALTLALVLAVGLATPASAAFSDVPAGAWYAADVGDVQKYGIIEGVGGDRFSPQGTLTLAQAITMTARIRGSGSATAPASGPWYQPYVDYLARTGICQPGEFGTDYDSPCPRLTMARLFDRVFPMRTEQTLNTVETIPDVADTAANQAVYHLYRQGILTGSDAYGTFHPDRAVTRAETAAILNRLLDASKRKTFSLQTAPVRTQRCVAIDPGHQSKANNQQEPIGPGASETKAKVTPGTYGKASGLHEYQLNLAVGLKLQKELESRGYRVVMTRTTHDVDLSNVQRTQIAVQAGADVLVRIHANGSTDASAHGAMTICMTPKSPYCAKLYPQSRKLSDAVLNGLCAATGSRKEGVWETDTMAGVNWSTIPVTIVELGYMTNQAEDLLMATEAYQTKLAKGMADGIDQYFAS